MNGLSGRSDQFISKITAPTYFNPLGLLSVEAFFSLFELVIRKFCSPEIFECAGGLALVNHTTPPSTNLRRTIELILDFES